MSNEIAERTIIHVSNYIIEVQNGCLNFIPRFAIFVRKKELYVSAFCSLKLGYNQPTSEQAQAVCEFV